MHRKYPFLFPWICFMLFFFWLRKFRIWTWDIVSLELRFLGFTSLIFLGVAEWMCSANSLHCLAELARVFFGFGLPTVTKMHRWMLWLCTKKWYNNYPMVHLSDCRQSKSMFFGVGSVSLTVYDICSNELKPNCYLCWKCLPILVTSVINELGWQYQI